MIRLEFVKGNGGVIKKSSCDSCK